MRRTTVIAIWIALGLLLVVAGGGGTSNDPGWGEAFVFVVPFIALFAAVGTGIVLMFGGFPGAGAGLVTGVIVAPILAVVAAFGGSDLLLGVTWLRDHFGQGIVEWLALWWPITFGVGVPVAVGHLAQHPSAGDDGQDLFVGSGGPAGADALALPVGTVMGGAATPSDLDPGLLGPMSRAITWSIGPPDRRRSRTIRAMVGAIETLIIAPPVLWAWALLALPAGWHKADVVDFALGHVETKTGRGLDITLQLLAAAPVAVRELLIGPRRGGEVGEEVESARPLNTLDFYRRDLQVDDEHALLILALGAVYPIGVIYSGIAAMVLGAPAPMSLAFVSPIVSFAAWLGAVLLADRFGRRIGDFTFTAALVLVPIAISLLTARLVAPT